MKMKKCGFLLLSLFQLCMGAASKNVLACQLPFGSRDPGEVRDVRAESTSPTTIHVTWNLEGEADGFRIELCMPVACENTTIAIDHIDGSARKYTLTHLNFYSEYEIKVRAFVFPRMKILGEESEKKTQRTLPLAPGKVRKLTCKSRTPTSIEIEWDPPAFDGGKLDGYKVTYYEDDRRLVAYLNQTHYSIENLKPNTSYIIEVLAYSESAIGTMIMNKGSFIWETTPTY